MNKHLVLIITLAGILIQPIIGKLLIPFEKPHYEAYVAEQNRLLLEMERKEDAAIEKAIQDSYNNNNETFTGNTFQQDDYEFSNNAENNKEKTVTTQDEEQIDEVQVEQKAEELLQKALFEAEAAHKERLKEIEKEILRVSEYPAEFRETYERVIEHDLEDENNRYADRIRQIKFSKKEYENIARSILTTGTIYY